MSREQLSINENTHFFVGQMKMKIVHIFMGRGSNNYRILSDMIIDNIDSDFYIKMIV